MDTPNNKLGFSARTGISAKARRRQLDTDLLVHEKPIVSDQPTLLCLHADVALTILNC